LRPKASYMDTICRVSSSVSAATCRLGRLMSLTAAGVRRNSVRVSRTSTVSSGTISGFSFAPPFDFPHVGSLRESLQKGIGLRAGLFARGRRGRSVGRTWSQTPTNNDFVDIWSAGTNPSPPALNCGRQWRTTAEAFRAGSPPV
jgi:hypothetical protein